MPDRTTVVVFGAGGAVGAALAQALADEPDLSLRLIDIETEPLEGLRSECVEVIRADLTDLDAVVEVCQGASMLMNCMSLTHFERIFDFAVDQRLHYADLISEPSDAQRVRAKTAGVVAVPGLGLTPGLSNILVRHASQELDVHRVEVLFAVFRTIAPSRGALDTVIWEGGEHCPQRCYYEDGRLIPAGPTDGRRTVSFGGQFGTIDVYLRPHPEPRSLPKNFPSIRYCAVRGTWQTELMAEIAVLNKYGLLDQEHGPRTTEAIWQRSGGITSEEFMGQTAVKVEVIGTDGGDAVRRTYDVILPQEIPCYPLTGICAAVGVAQIAHHAADVAGVLEPEVFFDPQQYLAGLRRQGVIDVQWRDEVQGGG
jgi:saccharopine dehydrogenase-like NADP-dependent oxidoreductase